MEGDKHEFRQLFTGLNFRDIRKEATRLFIWSPVIQSGTSYATVKTVRVDVVSNSMGVSFSLKLIVPIGRSLSFLAVHLFCG